jgi:hypothetical protein
MNKRWFHLMVVALSLIVLLNACAPSRSDAAAPQTEDVAPPPTSGEARQDPGEAVKAFYTWYLTYNGNVVADKAYHDSSMISASFAEDVDALIASFDRGGYDPFICAQNRPGAIEVGTITVSGDTAEVPVTSDLQGHALTVRLQANEEGEWLITDIDCGFDAPEETEAEPAPSTEPAPSAEPTAPSAVAGPNEAVPGWPVLVDETYNFMVQYPEGWVYEDVDLDDPNKPPAGKMSRLVFLQPEGWDQDFIVLQMDVYDMDNETFAMEFIPGTEEKEIVRDDGTVYTQVIHDFGQFRMYQYVFRSPSNPNIRVVFTECLTGWPDRIEGNEDVAAKFEPILQSFGFTQ